MTIVLPSREASDARYGSQGWWNGSIAVLAGIFVFMNPFPHVTAVKEISFYSSVVVLIAAWCFKKNHFSFQSPLTMPLLFFALWSLFDILWAVDARNSIHDYYAHLVKNMIIFFILINLFSGKNAFLALIHIVVISMTIYSATAFIYFYMVLKNPLTHKMVAFINENPPNITATLVASAFVLAFHALSVEKRLSLKILYGVSLLMNGSMILFSQSRGAIAGFCVSMFVLLFKNIKHLFLFLLSLFIIVGSFGIFSPYFKDRIQLEYIVENSRVGIFLTAVEIIKDYPVTGVGYGMETVRNLWDRYHAKIPERYKTELHFHSHNIFLDFITRVGIVGWLFFLYVFFSVFMMSARILKGGRDPFIKGWLYSIVSIFIGFLVAGLFDNAFEGKNMTFVFIFFALATILGHLNHGTTNAENAGSSSC